MHNSVYHAVRRALRPTLLLLCALPLCGCGGGNGDTAVHYQSDGTSGARGTAYLEDVTRAKTPYANGTVAATITVCPKFGERPCAIQNVVQAHTDAQGSFTLPLIPGTYGFAFVPPAGTNGTVLYTQGFSVTVTARQFTQIVPIGLLPPPSESLN